MQDLSKLTHMELLELQSKISDEWKIRENAVKLKIYVLTLPYDNSKSYLNIGNALDELNKQFAADPEWFIESYEKEDVNSISLKTKYVDMVYGKHCEDFVETV